MNYSKALKQMQLAYLEVTLRNEGNVNEEICLYCWHSKGCSCDSDKNQIKNDPFINLTLKRDYVYC